MDGRGCPGKSFRAILAPKSEGGAADRGAALQGGKTMGTIKRRAFLKTAAFACPFLAAGGGALVRAQQKKDEKGLTVLKDQCTGCGDCVKVCPVEAIALKDGIAVIDAGECIECDACIEECPTEAILYKKDLEAYKKEHPEKFEPARKNEPAKKDDRPSLFDPKFDSAGVWVMTGTFADGSTSSESIRFVGTAASGVIRAAPSNEEQGSYKIDGTQVEIRLPDGSIAKGRVVSGDRLEGALPGNAGKWRAEKKK
jgi:ferredoxin